MTYNKLKHALLSKLSMLLLCLIAFLPHTLLASSTLDTSKVNNHTRIIGVPDSIIRKATEMIIQGHDFMSELALYQNKVHLLNRMLFDKDSIIYEDSIIMMDDRSIINATNGKLDVSEQQKAQLKKNYTHLKVNDRVKMSIGMAILVGLVYIYIEKK